MSATAVADFESGFRAPSPLLLGRLAAALGASVDEFLDPALDPAGACYAERVSMEPGNLGPE
jgi:transcriptional regulator with XRE-family HTH domain